MVDGVTDMIPIAKRRKTDELFTAYIVIESMARSGVLLLLLRFATNSMTSLFVKNHFPRSKLPNLLPCPASVGIRYDWTLFSS